MRVKSLVTFRSESIGFEEGKMEKPSIPDPSTVWETSTVTAEQIQSLVDRGLLRPKSLVGWRPAAREAFPTEGTGETIIFIAHIEHGFGVPAGDFLRGLLQFYQIELVHLAPNSITIIATFIHLYEAFLGITPHFHLWRHFFEMKKTGKGWSSAALASCYVGTLSWSTSTWRSPTTPPAGSKGGSTSTTLHRR
jgi:hypothetical protein